MAVAQTSCMCSSPDCRIYGCRAQRMMCPPGPYYYGFGVPAQRGCICPPGAEMTCQGVGCPRKAVSGKWNITCTASAGEAGTATDSEAGVAEGEHATAEGGDAQKEQS